jgi:hypothetical protein
MNRRLSAVAAFKMIVLFRTVGNQSVTFRNMKKSVPRVSGCSAVQSGRSIVRDRRYKHLFLMYSLDCRKSVDGTLDASSLGHGGFEASDASQERKNKQ